MSIKEKIEIFLQENLESPLEVFHLEVRDRNKHFLVQLTLDNLENKYGSVNVEQCARVSRMLKEHLDADSEQTNYTLHVSSAGAERELRLPEDLERFQGIPVKLKLQSDDKPAKTEVYIIKSIMDGMVEAEIYRKEKPAKEATVKFRIVDIIRGNIFLDI